MERHKQLKIAAETSYIYAPLAHRLGLYNFKTEFLDLCMKITDSEVYQNIAKKLNETKKDRENYVNKFIAPLKEKLNELGFSYRIFGRPKSIYSIWNKIRTKKVEFEEVYDLFAVRIIIDVPADKERISCWQAYSVVTDVHTPIADRLKDWITTPKSNGYESLHTTVIGPGGRFVEVQIRTERMDEISEKGYAAHWKYKGISSQPDVYERWLDSVRETIENPSANAIEFLVDFRANSLFKEEVYIYTPKGDVQLLPAGSTALDFAFHIHTDVGYHCTSIRVNNKLVPFGKVLKNGDQIQVHTSKNQKPSEDWLKMTTTGKAQAKIRSAMKEERKRKGEIGKEYLERKLKNLKVEFDESLELILKVFDYKSSVDLYFDIATETRDIQDIFKRFHVDAGKLKEISVPFVFPDLDKQGAEKKTSVKPSEKPKLLVNGESAEQYEYSLANCCNPLPGDDIFAFLTHNVGLKIHRSSCPNAAHLMVNYGYRILSASWQQSNAEVNFIAEIKITGVDSGPGVIEQLSHQISSQLGLNIRSMAIEGDEGYFECRLKIIIKNTDQLHMVIKSLQALDNISSVVRLD
jgi:GTP pyrophosphokinase